MKAIDAILFDPVGVLTDAQGAMYEDARPALEELARLGVKMIHVGSATPAALAETLTSAALDPSTAVFLTGTEAGIRAAQAAGVAAVLMMNDPDEAMRLTALNPDGGIVSLLELPDFVRFVRHTS